VYGVSANRRRWWDLEAAERLGYRPVDDAEHWASRIDGPADSTELDEFQGADYVRRDIEHP